jgi:nucleotide-binding universal stress UspA family protein
MERAPRRDRLTAEPSAEQLGSPAVVVGIDGSETSWDAFWWACGEARRLGARTVAVFVSPASEANLAVAASAAAGAVWDYAAIEKCLSEQGERLRAEVERHGGDHALQLTFVQARGDPATELVRVAEEINADLIVVGRSAKVLHHVAGSIGRHLITRRGAPVVVIVP